MLLMLYQSSIGLFALQYIIGRICGNTTQLWLHLSVIFTHHLVRYDCEMPKWLRDIFRIQVRYSLVWREFEKKYWIMDHVTWSILRFWSHQFCTTVFKPIKLYTRTESDFKVRQIWKRRGLSNVVWGTNAQVSFAQEWLLLRELTKIERQMFQIAVKTIFIPIRFLKPGTIKANQTRKRMLWMMLGNVVQEK